MSLKSLIGLTREKLAAELIAAGVETKMARMRAGQVWHWIYQRGATSFDEMTSVSKALRATLAEKFTLARPEIVTQQISEDGTRKWLLRFGPGIEIEAVYIPEENRGTLCVSSQVGCTLTCRFCHTGTQKLVRNLSPEEIIAQVLVARDALGDYPAGKPTELRKVTNVVMMGMGEPLQNYDALVPALRTMLDDHGYGLSRRRVTVSTSGVVPMMDRLRVDCPVALAVSLHAPTDPLRNELVPLNCKYPLDELMAACLRYLEAAPRDFITFEYCMLDGVNDSAAQAGELLALIDGRRGPRVPCKLNLIPFNPFPASGLTCSPRDRVTAFAKVLQDAGVVTTIRKTRGDDIDAACGQLAGEVQDRTRAAERMKRLPIPVVALGAAAPRPHEH